MTTLGIATGLAPAHLKSQINLESLYTLPVGFNYSPDFQIFKNGRSYRSDFDFDANRPKGKAVYVDFQDGSDSNNGLSETSPLRNFDTALSIADAVEIHIKRGRVGTRGQISAGTNIFPRPMSIMAYGDGENPRLTSGEDSLNWSQNGTYPQVYNVLRSGTDDVFDFADQSTFDPQYGYHKPLTHLNSVSDVAATPGSYFTGGSGLVYVHTFDGRRPDDHVIVALNVPGLDCRSDIDLYIKDIDVYGFDFNLSYNVSNGTQKLMVENCKFIRSPNGDALFLRDIGFVFLKNILVAEAHEDGINYKTSTTITKALEENCISIRNGLSLSGNDNGSTLHDGCIAIRLNGIYGKNIGPNVADVNTGTQSVNLGCHAFSSGLNTGGDTDADFLIDDGQMWLQDCTTAGSMSGFGRSKNGAGTLTDLGGYIDGVGQDIGGV